ncbi:helix-turn-helix transcriptional regulator [Aldersonia sp. NBC_00410]|uniref:helix-turn-helix transcriptional regulator n=1 Tax=Aldersonia sp. NBC_00410 TaxID=2975954 RepID=UPI00225BC6B6|nr:helix-turn-helix transcriptional regulator [Aldersonia sp. NBC_00410]MCX5043706.1 helix-turn-helix transcriptional regulator [Aldersonia sp. NBC_00410]
MSSNSAGARREPAPVLRPYLRTYDGYRLAGYPPGTHVGMPSPHLTVVITIGDALEIGTPSHPQQSSGRFEALASGITSAPVTIVHDGNQHGVQLSLTPLGARALLGVPAAELGAWIVDLDAVIGGDGSELRERLAATESWDARFGILDDVLTRRLAGEIGRRGEIGIGAPLVGAWRLLVGSGGRTRVADVAAELGWSRRHLVGRFSAEFGVTPKESARIARFSVAHNHLRRPAIPSLAEVAATCGYYDQAHMAREWRELAGMSPSAWRANEFAFVQASGPAAGEDLLP